MSKNIVVLCDGTWNEPKSNSNVFALYRELINREYEQYTKYFEGVGVGETGLKLVIDTVMATSLDEKVKEAYKFIVSLYKPGDNIWLFGFSRGAYTVRSVAGLIRNCGIAKSIDDKTIDKTIDLAYEIYRNRNSTFHPEGKGTEEFKKGFSHPDSDNPPIKFLGLFDTVGAHGIPNYTRERGVEYLEFYDQVVPNVVKYARQALAVHERRSFFEPCHILPNQSFSVDVKESWFPGVHSEVGGGTSSTFAGNERISRASMLWMLENIAEAGGLLMNHTIEDYRTLFSPNKGAILSIRSLIFDRNFSYIPAVLLRDRVIELEVDHDNPNMLKRELLYKDGDWLILSDRKSLSSQYVSNTYEKLRREMEAKGIRLYNNIKYERLLESARL